MTLLSAMQPFIGIVTPKLLIDELMGQKRPIAFVLILTITGLLGLGIHFFAEFASSRYYPKSRYFEWFLHKKLDEKCMTIKFEHTEDPEAMNRIQGSRTAIQEWGDGMVSAVRCMFNAVGSTLSCIGCAGILVGLHPAIIALLIVNMAVVYYFKMRSKKKELEILPKISDCSRKTSYLENAMCDFEYGKDTRIYHMADWLTEKTWNIKKKQILLFYDYQRAKFLPDAANGVFMLFREPAVFGYLIYKYLTIGMSIGDFTMYFSTMASFSTSLVELINCIGELKGQAHPNT